MGPRSLLPPSLTRTPAAVAASLTTVLATVLVFTVVPSSSAGDEPKPVLGPRVMTREYGPSRVRKWKPDSPTGHGRAVSVNAWRRMTAEKTEVGVYIEALGAVEDASLEMDVATAKDLAEFLARAPDRAPAALAPIVTEAVAAWRLDPDSSFKCRLDLETGEVVILGSRGSVTIDAVEVAAALGEAIADASALRQAPHPLQRAAK
jgi:hypothetical protein